MAPQSAQDRPSNPGPLLLDSLGYPASRSVRLARRLSVFGLCLLLAYVLLILRGALPLQLINPAWQVAVSTALIDNAAIALVGLAIVHFAHYLDPDNERLQWLTSWVARLAILAALGFLLLIPLRAYDTWALLQQMAHGQNRQVAQAIGRLDRFRQVIQLSASKDDLQSRLRAIQAPPLSPSLQAQSLAVIKQELSGSLQKAQAVLERNRKPPNQKARSGLLIGNLRAMLTALIYAIAFAAGGQRPKSQMNFLEDVLQALARIRGLAGGAAKPRDSTQSHMEAYIQEISSEGRKADADHADADDDLNGPVR